MTQIVSLAWYETHWSNSLIAITMGLVGSRDATPVVTPQGSGRTSPVRLTVPPSPHMTPQHSPLNSPALTNQYDSSTGKRITQKFTFEWNKFCFFYHLTHFFSFLSISSRGRRGTRIVRGLTVRGSTVPSHGLLVSSRNSHY